MLNVEQELARLHERLIPILTLDNPRLPNRGGRWT
jgi:hypothetical protein